MRTTPALCAILLSCAAASAAEGYRRLNGAEIRRLLVGRSFADDTHFTFRYRRDGQIESFSMGRASLRRWSIAADKLCDAGDRGTTCYEVLRKGDAIRMQRDDDDIAIDGTVR